MQIPEHKTVLKKRALKKPVKGNAIVMFAGVFIVGLTASVMAIDLPAYYVAQNQLQTSVNAAAIAGAYELPESEEAAEAAAVEVAAENLVGAYTLDENNLSFEYETGANMTMEVTGEVRVPTIMGKVLCALTGSSSQFEVEGESDEDGGGSGGGNCNNMMVYAHAKAVPAARDTMLVIDTSSSMSADNRIGKVKAAARTFVDQVNALTNQTGSIDRIGLVKFDRTATESIGLTAKDDFNGAGFTTVKSKITALSLYSGSGWNTNYYVGLKAALDELETSGRKNAKQTIIFLTDGYPNLPAPANYISYSTYTPYKKCTDIIDNSTAVRNMCYYTGTGKNKKLNCYYMPDTKITNAMITSSGGKTCGDTYLDYMEDMIDGQVVRAEEMGVTIHTITVSELATADSSSMNMIRRMATKPADWTTEYVLANMAETTDGEQYASDNVIQSELDAIYAKIAEDVKVKLAY